MPSNFSPLYSMANRSISDGKVRVLGFVVLRYGASCRTRWWSPARSRSWHERPVQRPGMGDATGTGLAIDHPAGGLDRAQARSACRAGLPLSRLPLLPGVIAGCPPQFSHLPWASARSQAAPIRGLSAFSDLRVLHTRPCL